MTNEQLHMAKKLALTMSGAVGDNNVAYRPLRMTLRIGKGEAE
jgi:hypothetical protein